MTDTLWQQCLTNARRREREVYAKAPPRRPTYADDLSPEQWAQNDREAALLDHYAKEIRR